MDFEPPARRLQEIADGHLLDPSESLIHQTVTVSLLDLRMILAERQTLLVANRLLSDGIQSLHEQLAGEDL